MVPLEHLHVIEGYNAREKTAAYLATVRSIADSIKANGFYRDKAIAGFVAREGEKNKICIIGGHRRFEAANLAVSEGYQLEKVPVIIKPSGTSMEDLQVDLIKGNEGDPLKPIEVAVVMKRLIDAGLDVVDIATRVGVTKLHVENLLSLIAAPKAIRTMVNEGQVSATAAIDALKKHGAKAAEVLAEAAVEAKAAGKDKVTPKLIKKAAESKGAAKEVNLKLMKKLVSAQRKHTDAPGEWFDEFVAELTGATAKAVAEFRAVPVQGAVV